MTTISLIVAIDKNNAIGKGNRMLTHLPNDLKYFQKITSGHTVIMGRKTFESLPKGALPNRRNIVVSRNENLTLPNCDVASSIEAALKSTENESEVFIMGGGIIYAETINLADKVYLTHIDYAFDGAEVFFPEIDYNQWQKTWEEKHLADDRHKYDFTFAQYSRI